jgi:hypothetical protein
MRKKFSLLDPEKQKEIYKGFHSYKFNTRIDYKKAEILINKQKVYKEIKSRAEKKGEYPLGSNFERIEDNNYQTYEVNWKKILKIDNTCGNIFNFRLFLN